MIALTIYRTSPYTSCPIANDLRRQEAHATSIYTVTTEAHARSIYTITTEAHATSIYWSSSLIMGSSPVINYNETCALMFSHNVQWPLTPVWTLRWRRYECDGVSNHQPHDCLLKPFIRRRTKKTSKLRVTALCAGNPPVTGEFPAQRTSNADNVSIWCHHEWRLFSQDCDIRKKSEYNYHLQQPQTQFTKPTERHSVNARQAVKQIDWKIGIATIHIKLWIEMHSEYISEM